VEEYYLIVLVKLFLIEVEWFSLRALKVARRKPLHRREKGWIVSDWLDIEVAKLLPHGAMARNLMRDVPELVDSFYPSALHPGKSAEDRATKMEQLIRKAIRRADAAYHPPVGPMLRALLGLRRDLASRDVPLQTRCEQAGLVLDIKPESFIRGHRQNCLEILSEALYELHPNKNTLQRL
jgi:hypothetical protein